MNAMNERNVVGLQPWLPWPLKTWPWWTQPVRAERLAVLRIGVLKLSAAELRTKKAETMALELDRALKLIEDAIRTKLLGENPGGYVSRRDAAA